MQQRERIIYGTAAAAVFLVFLLLGGVFFQLLAGILAMLGVAELLRMKGLEVYSFEGVLAMLAAFFLTVPLQNYFSSLPLDASLTAYGLTIFLLLGGTVLDSRSYSFEDAAYPIAASFYVGIGFQNLVVAQMAGLNKVLLAIFIVWATDTGAYFVGRQIGHRPLLPHVSPNKTIEGSLGGIALAFIVAFIFMLIDPSVYAPHNIFVMLLLVILFSLFAQFGDLVESAIKRHFGVKDSGVFIPGHGGVLDRFDSMIFVLPIMDFFGLF
ncbi:phosphatidate cytidylyltransferase [Streptococcus cuniculipharyngis]|uniref:Phosphatidate cytidylyltransferase n=1 Tax=Streptococcus cuniculipharyngis TaxID=1562651 RepID=A0A5C5SD68_9STRE|nr:phosphatidate cytidylyltransferase [Streptococcus cuniculipharyngis]TWS97626.1 phosphatidate cytidylyltransferase [Streptococcus cuniculipharyngis]